MDSGSRLGRTTGCEPHEAVRLRSHGRRESRQSGIPPPHEEQDGYHSRNSKQAAGRRHAVGSPEAPSAHCPADAEAQRRRCVTVMKNVSRSRSSPPGQYPLATIATYGPDSKLATKLVVSVLDGPGQRDPSATKTWTTHAGDVRHDPEMEDELASFVQ